MARCEHHSLEPRAQIVVFDSSKDASRRPLYWRYTGDSKRCYNSCYLAVKYNRITASLAMADYVHVFEVINLTVLVQWKCVKQCISFSVIARY